MMRAFKLYTGPDNASHVLEGTIDEKDRTDVIAIHFKETPAHSSYDWHPDPEPQFVITLSGTLEFATPDGETFVVATRRCTGCRGPYRQRSQMASDRRSAVAARICGAEARCQGLVRTEYRHLRRPSVPPFLAAMP